MKKYIIVLTCILALTLGAKSQTATEALRLSTFDVNGTARNLGAGNSMYAIGPDFSAIGVNPAGIGGYWKGEFTGSMNLNITSYSSNLNSDSTQSNTQGNYSKFRLPNLGFIVATQPALSRWSTSNWAIGINRTADYDKEIFFSGNSLGSITDSWRENAGGLTPDELNGFEEGLAYTSGAIYDFESDNIYETDYLINPQYHLYKEESSTVAGGKTELFLGYGANLDQKLLIGFSVNLPIVNSDVNRIYREIDSQDGTPFFNELKYTSSINTTGYGVNGKFGIILKPSKNFNISLAAHTPTKFQLTDNFNTTVSYDYTDENHDGPILSESPYGTFQYGLKTPWRLAGGIGIIAGQYGFLSAGVQWADYSSMKFDYSTRGNGHEYDQEEREVNADIKQTYSSALQLNMGGELALQFLRIRAGFSMDQSAFTNDDSFDPSYHAGLGYRDENFFVDLGYSFTNRDEGYTPYRTVSAPQPLAVLDYDQHRLTATLGLKF